MGEYFPTVLPPLQHGPVHEDPLDSPVDTPERRRAKLKRLANDPAIVHVKDIFSARKPAALRALEYLVSTPTGEHAPFYNQQLKSFLASTMRQLSSFNELRQTEASKEDVEALKPKVGKLQLRLRQRNFDKFNKEQKLNLIEVVQTALKLGFLKEEETPSMFIANEAQRTGREIRNLKESLAVEGSSPAQTLVLPNHLRAPFKAQQVIIHGTKHRSESSRTQREILGASYPMYLENSWWENSEERKKMQAKFDRLQAEGLIPNI